MKDSKIPLSKDVPASFITTDFPAPSILGQAQLIGLGDPGVSAYWVNTISA
jgi:hypothetical protein